MKATMSQDGVITLTPESSVEAYALRKWADESMVLTTDSARDEQCYWRGSRLIAACELEAGQ